MNDKTHPLHWAHPLVQEWFHTKFIHATEPQIAGWPAILQGKDTLISAPTGSGKTFAAFLISVEQLIRKSLSATLDDQTEVLYISPLKALSNDVQKNLTEPLGEIAELAKTKSLKMKEVRVAVRTGDTLARDRQAMLKKPPHILVTTPESFFLLLTAEKSRAMLSHVKTVIIDEIHALANNKRGSHLTLSLERLDALTQQKPIRIGLSATQKPLETVAQFLVGKTSLPKIVNIATHNNRKLAIEVPQTKLTAVATHEMWDEIYDKLAELANQNRSTLIFVNTRKLSERIAHYLTERLGGEQVAAHHGSLSRQLRLSVENKLKNGELKALVATGSLELGIDIGTVDLVCQIGSPRAISIALQRVGRSGHWHGAISHGIFFPTSRDELVECAALIKSIKEHELDQLIFPQEPLDILAQQIVACCATQDWQEDELFTLVTNAFPYKNLSRATFDSLLEMLSEGISGSRGRYGALIFRDRVNGLVKARRGSRLTAILNGGAIPETGLFSVIAEPEEILVGTLDEDFAVESNRGDIILLGTTSWKVLRVENKTGRVIVVDAKGAPPSVPFWRGEAPARTQELSLQVANLRQQLSDLLNVSDNKKNQQWLYENCGLNVFGAQQLLDYILEGRNVLGAVPTQQTIIAERFFDESGGMQLVIHAPFGARINKAWGLALRKRFCRSFNFELQAAATDDGLNIALTEQHSFPLADVFQFLHPNTVKDVLVQAVLQSPLFNTRWRWTASRALALIRYRRGKKVPPNIVRMLADDLLAAVFPDAAACQDNLGGKDIELPNHPLINETMKDILNDALDCDGFIKMLNDLLTGKIKCVAVDTPLPSAFSHEILNANPYAYLDDAPLEERRARAVEMRHVLPETLLQEIGKLDPLVIKEVQEQAWFDVRNADELHDMLQTCIAFPAERKTESWDLFFEELISQGRAGIAAYQGKIFWLAAERVNAFKIIYPQAEIQQIFKIIEEKKLEHEIARLNLIKGWILHLGTVTVSELSELLDLDKTDILQTLQQLESTGLVLRGQYRENISEVEWCERRLLARIHQLTVAKLRKEIEPIQPMQFVRWLMKWQHLEPGTQLKGEQGLLKIIQQLQGFEIPANAWEKQILATRIQNYEPGMLDQLCLSGVVGWGRFSLHAAQVDPEKNKRIMPRSGAPITFYIREEIAWPNPEREEGNLSHVAKTIYLHLKEKGASFFPDLVRTLPHLRSEIEMGLWELATAGLVTADSFDNLRAFINPKRRLRKNGRSGFSLRGGRWSLITENAVTDPAKHSEAMCWILLKRYGVVFRDLLAREKNIPRWRELLIAFRRLEDRGEIRGGRFVSGFVGEQFALPYAIESLRAMRKKNSNEDPRTIAAVDPLNLVGIILPGGRTPAISGKNVELFNSD